MMLIYTRLSYHTFIETSILTSKKSNAGSNHGKIYLRNGFNKLSRDCIVLRPQSMQVVCHFNLEITFVRLHVGTVEST